MVLMVLVRGRPTFKKSSALKHSKSGLFKPISDLCTPSNEHKLLSIGYIKIIYIDAESPLACPNTLILRALIALIGQVPSTLFSQSPASLLP